MRRVRLKHTNGCMQVQCRHPPVLQSARSHRTMLTKIKTQTKNNKATTRVAEKSEKKRTLIAGGPADAAQRSACHPRLLAQTV